MTKHDKIIVAPIISFILLVLVLTILQNISYTSRKNIFTFDKGWEIYQNGVLASTDSLAQFKKDSYVAKGDKIILTRVLKDNKDELFPALIFKTEFTAVEIYLDGIEKNLYVFVSTYTEDGKYNRHKERMDSMSTGLEKHFDRLISGNIIDNYAIHPRSYFDNFLKSEILS